MLVEKVISLEERLFNDTVSSQEKIKNAFQHNVHQ